MLPNWYEGVRHHFVQHLTPFRDQPNLSYVQIGAFTGDASVWLMENVLTHPTSFLDDVDTWAGGLAMDQYDFTEVERVYDEKTARLDRVRKWKLPSAQFFAQSKETFDFIYIDGDHPASNVMCDAVDAFRHLKPGGLLAFDDYTWSVDNIPYNSPRLAVDAFLSVFDNQLRVIDDKGQQLWVRRTD